MEMFARKLSYKGQQKNDGMCRKRCLHQRVYLKTITNSINARVATNVTVKNTGYKTLMHMQSECFEDINACSSTEYRL